jgi:acetoacetate decarboxylase
MVGHRRLRMNEGEAMPAFRPYFPPLPSYYRDVAFQTVFFRVRPEAVYEYLPEPLEPDPDGTAVLMSIRNPFCTAYGPFNEVEFSVRCSYQGQMGFFDIILYHDSPRAICAGRERWGVPKTYAEKVEIETKGNLIFTKVIQEGVPVLTMTSSIERTAQPSDMIALYPWYDLKLIPRADGPGACVKQLLKSGLGDWQSQCLFQGHGSVEWHNTANSEMGPLAPLEVLGAFYEVASYSEVYAEILYDYLTPAAK